MSINRASWLYGSGGGVHGFPLTGIPRYKFKYTIDIILNPTTNWGDITQDLDRVSARNAAIVAGEFRFRAQTVELPSHSYDVATYNQYNRKRVVMTSINYNPITLTFHDTADSKVENFIRAYNLYYFGNFERPVSAYDLDTVPRDPGDMVTSATGEPANPSGTGYGYKPPTENKDKYLIKEIKIYRDHGSGAPRSIGKNLTQDELLNGVTPTYQDEVSVINPMLTVVQHDNLSYAESSPILWSLQFAYEAIEYGSFNRDATVADSIGAGG